MPQIRMEHQLAIFICRPERQEFEPGIFDHRLEVGIYQNLHAMPASPRRGAQSYHRQDVAIAAEGAQKDVHRETLRSIQCTDPIVRCSALLSI
jgi:hypothetical protein